VKERFILWLAHGFGAGLLPFSPGTFGSVVGFFWFGIILASGSLAAFCTVTIAGLALAVWVSSEAEKLLSSKDPGSVVIDEYTAYPLCYLAPLLLLLVDGKSFPEPAFILSSEAWPLHLTVFAAFRLFDIAKPWPIHKLQALPGGWGVVLDDVAAALCVNLPVGLLLWWKPNLLG
jgi:phosphatidylglycerophosphatase A